MPVSFWKKLRDYSDTVGLLTSPSMSSKLATETCHLTNGFHRLKVWGPKAGAINDGRSENVAFWGGKKVTYPILIVLEWRGGTCDNEVGVVGCAHVVLHARG